MGSGMFHTISDLLPAEDLDRVRRKAAGLDWKDGRKTAGRTAREVKSNLQADLTTPAGQGLHDFLMRAISGHGTLRMLARPARFSRLLLSRTEAGGQYGLHVDNALMGSGDTELRTDLSFTLFLSDPEAYEGGELCLSTSAGAYEAKPAAGSLVIYPSGAIHEVRPVASGSRLACVGWIQSRIQRADQREILFDLDTLRASLPETATAQRLALDKTVSNLIRMWAS